MKPGARLLATAAAVAALAGCSALDPYPTAPGPPAPGALPGQRVAICYDRLTTARAAVQKEAQKECPSGTAATPADTDWYMDFCPILLPWRATFVCSAAKK